MSANNRQIASVSREIVHGPIRQTQPTTTTTTQIEKKLFIETVNIVDKALKRIPSKAKGRGKNGDVSKYFIETFHWQA